MITAITIENFKGISEPVRLELRPITLLFGQNSAGKSSLLHALIYAREVFERHNLDADRTLAAGEHLDLGGFRTLVHDHEPKNRIRLRFDMNLETHDLPIRAGFGSGKTISSETRVYLDYLMNEATDAWVQIEIAWSEQKQAPYVAEYEIGLNNELVGCIRADASGRSVGVTAINHKHPLLRAYCDDGKGPSFIQLFLDTSGSTIPSHDPIGILSQVDALPVFSSALSLTSIIEEEPPGYETARDPFSRVLPEEALRQLRKEDQEQASFNSLSVLLEALFVGPGLLLRDALQQFRYIGPLRQVPPRDYTSPRLSEPSRWANGMAGWDLLYRRPALVDRVSRLLADPQRLNLGYTLEMVEFREFESRDRLLSALQSHTVDDLEDVEGLLKKVSIRQRLLFRPIEAPGVTLEPADLGVGVSQMIPALSAALDDQPIGAATLPSPMIAIEHPELNLHPRLQAELADVFLEGALSETTKGRIFFLETHSEVFALRFFRRVRESHRRQTGPPPGDGRGDGSGAGYGDGSGDGRGDGSGGGYGDGTGDGRGDGSGAPGLELAVKPTDVGVWYVDRATGVVNVKRIAVDVEGELIQPWPDTDSLFEQDFRERYG